MFNTHRKYCGTKCSFVACIRQNYVILSMVTMNISNVKLLYSRSSVPFLPWAPQHLVLRDLIFGTSRIVDIDSAYTENRYRMHNSWRIVTTEHLKYVLNIRGYVYLFRQTNLPESFKKSFLIMATNMIIIFYDTVKNSWK